MKLLNSSGSQSGTHNNIFNFSFQFQRKKVFKCKSKDLGKFAAFLELQSFPLLLDGFG